MSLNTYWTVALLSIVQMGCATVAERPELIKRKLWVSKEIPGLEFRYKVCVQRFMGVCFEWEDRKEYYNLNDEDIRFWLTNMSFVAQPEGMCRGSDD